MGKFIKIHGLHNTKVYYAWERILQRCENPKRSGYKNYGGRGISVCEKWHKFENFFSDMGHPPTPTHSIDRINNNGNYEPNNCRWATAKEQNNNSRSNNFVEFNGQRKTLTQWSEIIGISRHTLRQRLKWWPVEKAFTVPVYKIKCEVKALEGSKDGKRK